MSGTTEQLIQFLANDVTPARPLAPPSIRAGIWLAVSIPYLAVVLLAMVLRNGIPSLSMDIRFIIEAVSGLATGVAAAGCAFGSVVPAYNRKFFALFGVFTAIWLGSVAENCIREWLRDTSGTFSLTHDLSCLPFIVFAGLYPAVVLVFMLRRGAPLTPNLTAAVAGIAAAALGNFALRIVFIEDANVGLLVWHIGGVFVLGAIAGTVGHRLLNWRSIAGASKENIFR